MNCFREDRRNHEPVIARSSVVMGPIDGVDVPFCLKMEAKLLGHSTKMDMSLDTDQVLLPAPRRKERLNIKCVASCGRSKCVKSDYTFGKFDSTGFDEEHRQMHGFYMIEHYKYFFLAASDAQSFFHIATLEFYEKGQSQPVWAESSWHCLSLGKRLRTATWNERLNQGTDILPLVYVRDNELALKSFRPRVFEGSIVLVNAILIRPWR